MTETNEARPLATAGTQATGKRVTTEYGSQKGKTVAFPSLCSRCAKRWHVEDNGEVFFCGLMTESMKHGTPIPDCIYFEKVRP